LKDFLPKNYYNTIKQKPGQRDYKTEIIQEQKRESLHESADNINKKSRKVHEKGK
jgi:hypothetical protein